MVKPAEPLGTAEERAIYGNYHGLRNLFFEVHQPVVAEVLGTYVEPGSEILEIGSGSGELYSMLPEPFRPGYTGLEVNANLLAANQAKHSDVRLVQGSAYALPFENASFDAVIGLDVLDILTDYQKALRQARRVLKSGGHLVHFHDLRPNLDFAARLISNDFIPFPGYDEQGSLRQFLLLPRSDYNLGQDQAMDTYVHQVRFDSDLLERLQALHKTQLEGVTAKARRLFGDRLQPSPTFRELYTEALTTAAERERLEVVEAEDYEKAQEVGEEAFQRFKHVAPGHIPDEARIVYKDTNGITICYPRSDSDQPVIASALNVMVFRKKTQV